MPDAFHLQIISPTAIVVDAYVPMTEIPGSEGDFGVLPGHAPLFSMIRPGVITVHMSDGHNRRFFAASGYADVTQTSCTILSDHIQDMADITTAEAREALSAAEQAVSEASTELEKTQAEKLVTAAQALVTATDTRHA